MSAGTIQSKLSDESKALWGYRSVKEQVILMDWESDDENISQPISILKNILLNWDPDVEYENPILILSGGYGGFMDFYPALTTKNINRRPKKFDTAMEIVNLEEIEYSTFHEVPMRDDRIFQPMNNVPQIDRSSKAAAEKLYSTEQLLQEREKLLDRSLLNEQNILDKITELKDENIQKYDGDEEKLHEAELNINNERMELEDQQEELLRIKLDYDRIQQQLKEEIAKNEQYRMDVDSTINAEIEKRIAEKERQAEELREKRKREAHEVVEKKRRESEVSFILTYYLPGHPQIMSCLISWLYPPSRLLKMSVIFGRLLTELFYLFYFSIVLIFPNFLFRWLLQHVLQNQNYQHSIEELSHNSNLLRMKWL